MSEDTTDRDGQSAEKDAACPNPHGADGIIECWSPGGPCPDGRAVCEMCGPCNLCVIPPGMSPVVNEAAGSTTTRNGDAS